MLSNFSMLIIVSYSHLNLMFIRTHSHKIDICFIWQKTYNNYLEVDVRLGVELMADLCCYLAAEVVRPILSMERQMRTVRFLWIVHDAVWGRVELPLTLDRIDLRRTNHPGWRPCRRDAVRPVRLNSRNVLLVLCAELRRVTKIRVKMWRCTRTVKICYQKLTACVDNFEINSRLTATWIAKCCTVCCHGTSSTSMAYVHHRFRCVWY